MSGPKGASEADIVHVPKRTQEVEAKSEDPVESWGAEVPEATSASVGQEHNDTVDPTRVGSSEIWLTRAKFGGPSSNEGVEHNGAAETVDST